MQTRHDLLMLFLRRKRHAGIISAVTQSLVFPDFFINLEG